jgi:hypothetical protein
MNKSLAHRYARARHVCAALLLAASVVLTARSAATAQPNIEVRAVRGLDFGVMFRGGLASVAQYSGNAALFEITGRPGRGVQVTIRPLRLERAGGGDRGSLDVVISPARCAYSLDDGMSWIEFGAGAISRNIQIPERGPGAGRIIVRIGGDIAVGDDQHRGDYAGSITVTAIYE